MTTTETATLLSHWIGGGPDDTPAERHGEVSDPATGEIIARVPFATAADVDRAVRGGDEGRREWGAASIAKRADVLFAMRAARARAPRRARRRRSRASTARRCPTRAARCSAASR